jgi:hypothetical protein
MSAILDNIRNKCTKINTLEAEYEEEDNRKVPHYDKEAKKKKASNLQAIADRIAYACAGVARDIRFQDAINHQFARRILELEGVREPKGTGIMFLSGRCNTKGLKGEELEAKQKEIREYLGFVDEVVDTVAADVYARMADDDKPFGWIAQPDGSKQKTLDGQVAENFIEEKEKKDAEKTETKPEAEAKPKGKKAGKVTTKKIVDDAEESTAKAEDATASGDSGNETSGGSVSEAKTETSKGNEESATSAESSESTQTESAPPAALESSDTGIEAKKAKPASEKAPLSLEKKSKSKAKLKAV